MSVAFNPVRQQFHAAHLARKERLFRPPVATPPVTKQATAGPVIADRQDDSAPPIVTVAAMRNPAPLMRNELPHASGWLHKRTKKVLPASYYIEYVAFWHGVTKEDILGPRRYAEVATARWDAMAAVAVARPDYSLTRLGQLFNRDHSTLLHALRKMGVRPPRSASSSAERGE